ncbi:MAG TPA: bacillithiol biosynthesis cysteine-adding enzyme BshC [Chitinophagaceae bacterium]|nr:bacillithiol biosynthesis cysteine-adding enzyme BshC [Chitinophagaceae bacterium]
MQADCTQITYHQTEAFSKIVTDYLDGAEGLRPFYEHPVNLQGIHAAIQARRQFSQNRQLLVSELKLQYQNIPVPVKLEQNIESLADGSTFTVTTAHQPNIFTGPIYFVYKILHAIKLAAVLSKEFPACKFVPVYYMGSEDADLDELGSITVNGRKYTWQTNQTGAVGRMKVDANFIALILELNGQLGVEQFGEELVNIFKQCYRKGITIQQATLELVNTLFGAYGLVVLIPDNANLKKAFNPVVEKELREGFSHMAVSDTIGALGQNYKVQAGGRELNLFYLLDDKRERLEKDGDKYFVKSLQLEWTQEEILNELEENPERFSGNVILRGAFQETVLPNIAFIGGGGELAYWLELKKVFKAVAIPYPVLVLRNSFLVMDDQWRRKISAIGFNGSDIFKPEQELLDIVVERYSDKQFELNGELSRIEDFYSGIKEMAVRIDSTLSDHVDALKTKTVKRLLQLEKKMKSAEKRKFAVQLVQIQKLKEALFPNNNLQERVENLSGFYAKYGSEIVDVLLDNSLSLEQGFCLLTLK